MKPDLQENMDFPIDEELHFSIEERLKFGFPIDEGLFLDEWQRGKHSHRPEFAFLLLQMDPDKLLAASDPLPPGDVFVVYRGVAGVGDDRRIRGYSWSGSLDIALGFATMRGMYGRLPDPAVYRATIGRKDVLAYINHPLYFNQSYVWEEEFIVRPGRLSEPEEIVCPTKESVHLKLDDGVKSISATDMVTIGA